MDERDRVRELEEKAKQRLMGDGWTPVSDVGFHGYLSKIVVFPDASGKVDFICGRRFCAPDGQGGYYLRGV